MDATHVSARLRRSIPEHDAYTVCVANRRVRALATASPDEAHRWIDTTRWLHHALFRSGRLVVGLGVQWTPVRGRGDGQRTPPPATLQLCVGHRCLVFHLAHVDPEAVPDALYRFLADPRVLFVGYGSSYDRRMLGEHYGLDVEYARDLRALAGMGNASLELMAQRFLGYPGISQPRNVAMSAWHAPRLSLEQVEYACVDAYLAFRLGVLLCPGGHQTVQRAPVPPRAPPPRTPVIVHAPPRAPVLELPRAPPPAPRAPRAIWLPRVPPPSPRTPERHQAVAVDAAESSSKITQTRPGFTGSDTETEGGVVSLVRSNYASPGFNGSDTDTETEGGVLSLLRSNYASPGFTGSEVERGGEDDHSSDEFELQAREAATDDDEEEEDVRDYDARTGILKAAEGRLWSGG